MADNQQRGDKNPWLGLRTYDESSTLYGRDRDIDALEDIVSNNIAMVIFGKSGVGKSSLIHAGMTPRLHHQGKPTVYIRLEHNSDEGYADQIIRQTKAAVNCVDSLTNDVPSMGLWDFFHRHSFTDDKDNPVYPVIILDQFEEIFTLADAEHKGQSLELFQEMADLFNNVKSDRVNEYEQAAGGFKDVIHERHSKTPSLVIRHKPRTQLHYHYVPTCHFVICIREDYLFYLERNTSKIPALKINRYSLQAFNEDDARDVIQKPVPGQIDDPTADAIIAKIASVNDDGRTEIDPTLLSIYMYRYWCNKSYQETDNIIEDYYIDETKCVSADTMSYLESHLITGEGFRHAIPLNDVLAAKVTREEIDNLVSSRIVTIEPKRGHEYLEFSHDVLCPIARDHREKRKLRLQAQRLHRRIASVTAAGILTAILIAAFCYLNLRVIQTERELAVTKVLNESSRAHYMIMKGDVLDAVDVLLEVINNSADEGDALLPETERVLREANDSLNSSYACIAVLNHKDDVLSAQFSKDGSRIVTTCADGTVQTWNAVSCQFIESRPISSSQEKCDTDGNGSLFIVDDEKLMLRDKRKDVERCIYSGDFLTHAEYSPDKRSILVATSAEVVILDAVSERPLRTLAHHTDMLNYAAFSPDGRFIATASDDQKIRLWAVDTGQLIHTYEGHSNIVKSVCFSPDGCHLLSASRDNGARVWNVRPSSQNVIIPGGIGEIAVATFSPDGKYIAAVSNGENCKARIWDASSLKVIHGFTVHGQGVALRVELGNDAKQLTIIDESMCATTYDVNTGKAISTAAGESRLKIVPPFKMDQSVKGHGREICCLCNSHDGSRIVSASSDNTAIIWDKASQLPICKLSNHLSEVFFAEFSADDAYVFTASTDGTARLWNTMTGCEVLCHRVSSVCGYTYAISPGGDKYLTVEDESVVVRTLLPTDKLVTYLQNKIQKTKML